MRPKVGYIGLGAMGRALAGHLAGSHDLYVWDLSPDAIEALVVKGATAARSIEEMGRDCELVILCLPRSVDVEQVLFGKGGLSGSLRPGSIVVDQTSGVPAESRRLAERLAAQGGTLIDAPVAGGVPSAIAGAITIMASGSREAYDKALPALHAITSKVFWCSARVGDGQALKSINNIINAANRLVTLEVVALGRALGFGMKTLSSALDDGPSRSFITMRLLPAIAEGLSSTDFALALMVKDLNQAIALGDAVGASMPLSDLARGIIQAAYNTLGSAARLDDVVSYVERATGQQFLPQDQGPGEPGIECTGTDELVQALADCYLLIACENLHLAIRAGLDPAAIAPVIESGSASSAAATAVFASFRGEAAGAWRLDDAVARLGALAAHGARLGVSLLMLNTVRGLYVAAANRADMNAGISALMDIHGVGAPPLVAVSE